MARRVLTLGLAVASAAALAGCQFVRDDINRSLGRGPEEQSRRSDIAASQVTTIGVNAYLWRASLDTLSFMPLLQTDSNGGVIVTDWYVNPEKPDERFKCTVYILDSRLRADGLNVSVTKEVSNGQGGWITAPASPQTETDIENAILTRARQLRLSSISH